MQRRSKEWSTFNPSLSKQSLTQHHLSEIISQLTTFDPPLFIRETLQCSNDKFYRNWGKYFSINISPPPLIIHFTICSASLIVTWAGESARKHNVGGCPFVGMHSICVGCLLGSALLWIGHWRARAPWLQSDRCRLVGASLLNACRQTHKPRLFTVPTLALKWLRERCESTAHAPESTSLASDPPSVCLHPIAWLRCCE